MARWVDGATTTADPVDAALEDVVVALLKAPQLAEPDWESLALCVEVSEHRIASTMYRYRGDGPPQPTRPVMEAYDAFQALWAGARAAGTPWDVLIMRLERRTGRLAVEPVAGAAAERWRVTPATIDALPEALRPRPEHFGGSRPGPDAEPPPPEWWAERFQEVVDLVRSSPDLAGTDWDTCGVCLEVTETALATTAYRYLGDGPPLPVDPAEEVDDLIWDLWDAARAAGTTWGAVLIKLERATGRVAVDLVPAADAEPWRVTPGTMEVLPEALRPRPEDFA